MRNALLAAILLFLAYGLAQNMLACISLVYPEARLCMYDILPVKTNHKISGVERCDIPIICRVCSDHNLAVPRGSGRWQSTPSQLALWRGVHQEHQSLST